MKDQNFAVYTIFVCVEQQIGWKIIFSIYKLKERLSMSCLYVFEVALIIALTYSKYLKNMLEIKFYNTKKTSFFQFIFFDIQIVNTIQRRSFESSYHTKFGLVTWHLCTAIHILVFTWMVLVLRGYIASACYISIHSYVSITFFFRRL